MKIFNLFVLALTLLNYFPAMGESLYSQHQVVNDSLMLVEKVYLHTDRDTYYPGDNIWFKAYLVAVEGITSTGIPVTGKTEYEVK
jgi:hypothetical protein